MITSDNYQESKIKITNSDWPYGIGVTRFINIPITTTYKPLIGEQLHFEIQDKEKVHVLNESSKIIGEILDENIFLQMRHAISRKQFYIAQVTNVSPASGQIQVKVSLPINFSYAKDPIQILLTPQVRSTLQHKLRVPFENREDLLDQWLDSTFLYQGRFLVTVPDNDQIVIISPFGQLVCKVYEDSFLSATDTKGKGSYLLSLFERASLIECARGIQWLSSETNAVRAVQGALTLLQSISSKSKYFEIWQEYLNQEKEALADQAASLSNLAYDHFEYFEEVIRLYFDSVDQSIIAKWLDFSGTLSIELLTQGRKSSHPEDKKDSNPYSLGLVRKITSHYIDIDRTNDPIGLPPKGTIKVSSIGDLVQFKRQESAIERLAIGQTPIPNLENLIVNGSTEEILNYVIPPFIETPARLANGFAPFSRQEEAVGAALNTTDICLIQGPPGTGKTTVIRTILRRLKDEGARHLLVSSHQHTAVDNALSGLQDS